MSFSKWLMWFKQLYPLFIVLLLVTPIKQSVGSDVIGPDDVLRISVYGYEDLKTETRVSKDGLINFPLIGEINVGGQSILELEDTIAYRLIEGGFIQEAQVNITVLEHVSQQISVLGYVHKPGRYTLNSESSIFDLIAMAGGLSEMGDNKAVITRTVDGKQQKHEVNLLSYLQGEGSGISFKINQGDVIYIPKAEMFYIYGEVQHPGGYRLDPELTVIKALSIAGGLTLRGSERGVTIKRKDGKGILQEMDVELGDAVLVGDVIYVGERWF